MRVILKVATAVAAVLALPLGARAGDRPNILFIYLDDFGWKDAGFMGSDFYETPHLDRLAKSGLVFTDAYSSSANCAPARACLLSGQYTPRHGIYNVGTRPRGEAAHRRLEHIEGKRELRSDIVTWAESLQAAGYATGLFGKWHLGGSPRAQGFDVAVEHNKLPGFKGHIGPNGEYLADVLTERTMDFIRDRSGKPWCAYLSHYAVHVPLQPKASLLAKYRAKTPGELHNHIEMATKIQAVDDGVGRLVTLLEELGERDNTAIFFSSDNGGYGPATDMDPLWSYKGAYYEGGIRVPFFVNWPKGGVGGRMTSAPIIGVDVFPTFLDLAGAEWPAQPLDGQSLAPLIRGEAEGLGERSLFWHFPAYLESYSVFDEQRDPIFRTRPCSVIRKGDWKLHEYFEDSGVELYNLRTDIRERTNRAASDPEKAIELLGLLRTWRAGVGAAVPRALNPEFDEEAERAAIRRMTEPGE